jgi:hypothetical protein
MRVGRGALVQPMMLQGRDMADADRMVANLQIGRGGIDRRARPAAVVDQGLQHPVHQIAAAQARAFEEFALPRGQMIDRQVIVPRQ